MWGCWGRLQGGIRQELQARGGVNFEWRRSFLTFSTWKLVLIYMNDLIYEYVLIYLLKAFDEPSILEIKPWQRSGFPTRNVQDGS